MNEQIEKLWNKAKQSHADEVTDGDLSILNLESPFVQVDIRKKFAELIIKETIQVARAGVEFGNGMEDAVYNYFGIEE